MSKQQGLCILGSTGSIGQNTLNVVAQHPSRFNIIALCANRSYQRLFQQCLVFHPEYAVLADDVAANKLSELMKSASLKTKVLSGENALCEVVTHDSVDKVMSAIMGAKGLLPTLTALKASKTVLIANKEPLVMAGELICETAKKHDAVILPVDSEHNGVFQCLPEAFSVGQRMVPEVEKITLTASGGPFWGYEKDKFDLITPEMACQHPNWKMGPKITVDSATLMNKGLEVIEACKLFNLSQNQIDVLVHPQSVVHAMVNYCDGSILAHLGSHDMRIAIAHSLAWPQRITSSAAQLDLIALSRMDFFEPDMEKFPCLRLAYDALSLGKGAPNVLNACNEEVVHAFLEKKVRFKSIPVIIDSILNKYYDLPDGDLDAILTTDSIVRKETLRLITQQ